MIGGVVGSIPALALTLAFIFIYTTGLFGIAREGDKKLTLKEIIPLSMFCVMSVAIGAGLVDISPILASNFIKIYIFFNPIEIHYISTPITIDSVTFLSTTADPLLAIGITAPIFLLVALTVICIAWEYISDKIEKILPKGKPKSDQEEIIVTGADAEILIN